ncbi:hypothetical protein [Deinococcus arcticus]|uniref:hypothetical protein n=1 Tax=Deinococcus arcticus TaxID=2136176 RepID=UPI0011B226B4|nr:hypothetical protein [Deinococcus arcticus]
MSIACYDTVAAYTGRLRCAALVPQAQEAGSWRQRVRRWVWTTLATETAGQLAADLMCWRSLPHERIRQLGFLRNVMADLRRHPEFIAGLPEDEAAELARWLALTPMR